MDTARFLAGAQAQSLERVLVAFERKTGHQVVVLTVPSLNDEPIEVFSLRVAEAYRLGRRAAREDDGVLLVLSAAEHRARIEVGQGLEGLLPDITCGRILRDVMAPALARGAAYEAVSLGLQEIMKHAGADGVLLDEKRADGPELGPGGVLFIVALLGFMLWAVGPTTLLQLLFIFGSARGRGGDDRFDGKGGRFGGGGASGGW